MKVVYKYPLEIIDRCGVRMPRGAKLLHVGMQRGAAQLWALVNTDAPEVTRCIRIAGTGHPLNSEGEFVCTFFVSGGELVFHVFDEGELP